jgi:hypothetical protein
VPLPFPPCEAEEIGSGWRECGIPDGGRLEAPRGRLASALPQGDQAQKELGGRRKRRVPFRLAQQRHGLLVFFQLVMADPLQQGRGGIRTQGADLLEEGDGAAPVAALHPAQGLGERIALGAPAAEREKARTRLRILRIGAPGAAVRGCGGIERSVFLFLLRDFQVGLRGGRVAPWRRFHGRAGIEAACDRQEHDGDHGANSLRKPDREARASACRWRSGRRAASAEASR